MPHPLQVWLVPAAGLGSLIGSASIWEAAFLVPIESRTVVVWQNLLYQYGIFGCMKKTLHIDEVTLRDAKKACGASTDTETVRLGLEALIRHAAYERLRKLRGSDRGATDVPRRRPGVGKTRALA